MNSHLRKWLTDTGYYATITDVTNTGDPTYSAPQSFLCRVQLNEWFHGPTFLPRHGEDMEAMNFIFTETAIPKTALIWLPGEDQTDLSLAHKVNRMEAVKTREGAVSHYEIWVT